MTCVSHRWLLRSGTVLLGCSLIAVLLFAVGGRRRSISCDLIQVEIGTVCSNGGGEVLLQAANYRCDRPVILACDKISLRGRGPDTLLHLASMANSPVLVVGDTNDPPSLRSRIQVSDLRIDGNREKQDVEVWADTQIRNSGIVVRGVSDVLIERIIVSKARSAGVVVEKGSVRVNIRGLISSDNFFDGLAAYETEDSIFSDLLLYENLQSGLSFDLNFDRNVIGDAVITDNGHNGIFMRCSKDNQFHGLQIRNSTEHGIFLADAVGDPTAVCTDAATGNSFTGLTISDSGQNAAPGEGFCVTASVGGAGICVNNASATDNLVCASQLTNNVGGNIVEDAPVQECGNILR